MLHKQSTLRRANCAKCVQFIGISNDLRLERFGFSAGLRNRCADKYNVGQQKQLFRPIP